MSVANRGDVEAEKRTMKHLKMSFCVYLEVGPSLLLTNGPSHGFRHAPTAPRP